MQDLLAQMYQVSFNYALDEITDEDSMTFEEAEVQNLLKNLGEIK